MTNEERNRDDDSTEIQESKHDLFKNLPKDLKFSIMMLLDNKEQSFFGQTCKDNNKLFAIFFFNRLLFNSTVVVNGSHILDISLNTLNQLKTILTKIDLKNWIIRKEERCWQNKFAWELHNSYAGYPILLVICYLLEKKQIRHDDAKALIKALLEKGADPNERYNGIAPLHLMAKRFNDELVELLLEYGADPNIKDSQERTPLFYLWQKANFFCVFGIATLKTDKQLSTTYLLIAAGADANKNHPEMLTGTGTKISSFMESTEVEHTYCNPWAHENSERIMLTTKKWLENYVLGKYDLEKILRKHNIKKEANSFTKVIELINWQIYLLKNILESKVRKQNSEFNRGLTNHLNKILVLLNFLYSINNDSQISIDSSKKQILGKYLNQFCELRLTFTNPYRHGLNKLLIRPIVKAFLKLGADPNIIYDEKSIPTLAYFLEKYTSEHNDYQTIRLLLEYDADPNVIYMHNNKEKSFLKNIAIHLYESYDRLSKKEFYKTLLSLIKVGCDILPILKDEKYKEMLDSKIRAIEYNPHNRTVKEWILAETAKFDFKEEKEELSNMIQMRA